MVNVKMYVPEVVKLNDLVAYQNGSVVSRTLIEKDCGTVTAFAFDENQGLSEHTSPYDALIIIIEGKVDIRISKPRTCCAVFSTSFAAGGLISDEHHQVSQLVILRRHASIFAHQCSSRYFLEDRRTAQSSLAVARVGKPR